MRPSFRPQSLPAAVIALSAVAFGFTPTAVSQEPADTGYTRSYTIRAEGAWLPDGRVLSPAYVSLDKGVITRMSTNEPPERRTPFGTQKPTIIEVEGVLAPSIVDAWSGLPMAGRSPGRRAMADARVADDLPILVPGAEPALAARVAMLRDSGVGFVYLGRTDDALQRGLGVVAGFSAHDLPYAIGEDWIDLSGAGSGAAVQVRAQDLRAAFAAAVALREAREDHAEKLEKYEEDLKKYEEDFAKYLEEHGGEGGGESTEESGGGNGGERTGGQRGSGRGGARGQRPPRGGGMALADQEPKKADEKRPKRPSRPEPPKRNAEAEILLDAIDGKRAVRLEADDANVIAAALDLVDEHHIQLLLVGGREAAAHAERLAELEVGIVLDLSRQLGDESELAEDFAALTEEGVAVALGSGGRDLGPMLLTLAGELIADGVDAQQVWTALTATPARLLGIDGQAGVLRSGASGSMILFEGSSPFDASGVFRTHKPK